MRHVALVGLVALNLGAAPALGISPSRKGPETPVTKVVHMLQGMVFKLKYERRRELQSYDRFACWCEDMLGRKATDIQAGKAKSAELQSSIVKLMGDLGAHGAEIKELNKLIAANLESQREATGSRQNQAGEYGAEKIESEQCIGALEAAIKVLSGAGTKKTAFLADLQEAKLLSVASSVKEVLGKRHVLHSVSDKDLELVSDFFSRPRDVSRGHAGVLSATQIAENPFGDYAPQSTQIQGILKGMYDAFASSLEKANADEAKSVKAFDELMATLRQEQNTLEGTLQQQTLDKATKSKALADARMELDDTKDQLAADEKLFADTKASSVAKATEWSERARLRTEELQGIHKAIAILSDPETTKTFETAYRESYTTSPAPPPKTIALLQLLSSSKVSSKSVLTSLAYERLRDIAKQRRSLSLTKVATAVMAGGHFDKVIIMIDHMISLLRQEEQDDIAHRDRCQAGQDKNTNKKEDINHDIGKADLAIGSMTIVKTDKNGTLDQTTQDISDLERRMAQRLQLRTEEHDDFTRALKADVDAVAAIEMAIRTLNRFYKDNRISLTLLQGSNGSNPEYTFDNNTPPELDWQGDGYGGHKSATVGIISILSMIKEDLEKEMKTGRQDDTEAEAMYEAEHKAMQSDLAALKAKKVNLERTLADVNAKMEDIKELKNQKTEDLFAEGEMTKALEKDCTWMHTHFDSRREKRKAEIQGLQEAKDFLAGVDSGTDEELPID